MTWLLVIAILLLVAAGALALHYLARRSTAVEPPDPAASGRPHGNVDVVQPAQRSDDAGDADQPVNVVPLRRQS